MFNQNFNFFNFTLTLLEELQPLIITGFSSKMKPSPEGVKLERPLQFSQKQRPEKERTVIQNLKQEKPNIAHGNTPERTAQANATPWNEWLRLARQGDESATLRFCAQAEPFIEQLCNVRFFAACLGKEECRSVASLSLVEFLMTYPSPPENAEIPFLLKGVMRNALLNRVKRMKSKNRYEQRVTALQEAGDTETEEDAIDNIPAPKTEEPEAQTLQKELQVIADTALKQLKPSEQAMIRFFFFQNKTAAAIAKELQCSRQYVEKMRNKALSHLRKLLKGYHIFNDGAFSC